VQESKTLQRVREMATEVADREGCFLYDLELVGQGRGRVLRVYIDKDSTSTPENDSGDPGTGASVDDCANVSRGLGLMLDVEEPLGGEAYELEVSTPGLERTLKQTWHFEKAVGQNVQISANAEIPCPESVQVRKAPKSLTGVLKSADDEAIELESQDVVWVVPRTLIHKAKIKYVFEHPGANKPKGNKRQKKKAKR